MKKKSSTYLLLIIVLGVWGTIGYKFFTNFNTGPDPILVPYSEVSFTPNRSIGKDTFSINTNHRDPFLGTLYKKEKPKIVKPQEEPLKWINIVYKGKISSQRKRSSVYVLEVGGQQELLKVGEESQGVRLIRGSRKSILVSFKGRQKIIEVEF